MEVVAGRSSTGIHIGTHFFPGLGPNCRASSQLHPAAVSLLDCELCEVDITPEDKSAVSWEATSWPANTDKTVL